MDPNKQRRAIARACGWSDFPGEPNKCHGPEGMSAYWSNVPEYLDDLNAMHEAEATLTKEQGLGMAESLMRVLNDANRNTPRWLGPTAFDYLHATAAQRAEAFLRTVGKWEP